MKKVINTSVHNWVNNNLDMLKAYKGKWIAYTVEDNLIAVAENLSDLKAIAEKKNRTFVVFFVNPAMFRVRILPIYFRTVITHDWKPTYTIGLSAGG